MQIRCNFSDISYLSETQKNNFQFLSNKRVIALILVNIVSRWYISEYPNLGHDAYLFISYTYIQSTFITATVYVP